MNKPKLRMKTVLHDGNPNSTYVPDLCEVVDAASYDELLTAFEDVSKEKDRLKGRLKEVHCQSRNVELDLRNILSVFGDLANEARGLSCCPECDNQECEIKRDSGDHVTKKTETDTYCQKCYDAGWVWQTELDGFDHGCDLGTYQGASETRVICDRCGGHTTKEEG